MSSSKAPAEPRSANWLVKYYATRAAFSAIWVATAFALGKSSSPIADVLLVVYPAWDALANLRDAASNGGIKSNPTQAFNVLVSTIVTVGVGAALATDPHIVFFIFGAWAFLAGILQLATGVRRWRAFGAQWPMILSGPQSALAGTHFVTRGLAGMVQSPKDIALYAAFGVFYFAIAAVALLFTARRRRAAA